MEVDHHVAPIVVAEQPLQDRQFGTVVEQVRGERVVFSAPFGIGGTVLTRYAGVWLTRPFLHTSADSSWKWLGLRPSPILGTVAPHEQHNCVWLPHSNRPQGRRIPVE
jgi:hypothetical protein